VKVRVRMYRQGLGDCFLLTFDPGGTERHMLIDCGTLGATTTGVKLPDVVSDIRKTTNDHIHLVVGTHEHWDHVRGFGQITSEFNKIQVDHVWMAWTENPADPLAQKIAKNKKDLGTALAAASRALIASSDQSKQIGLAVQDLLEFYGEETVLGAGAFSDSVNQAMNVIRLGLTVPAEFHNPGDGPTEPDWLPGFRFYILGPPRDQGALNDTGEHGSAELYGIARALTSAATFRISDKNLSEYRNDANTAEDAREFESQIPFDLRFRRAQDDVSIVATFKNTYFSKAEDWRRVDDDWLHCASDLALQLDSATNNTSLAIAIERVADGKILVFPADAQEGNWLSWHNPNMKWSTTDPNGKALQVTATDLLKRTVFYKAGHHASHNGTAKPNGLELMEQEQELTAFISVDRAVALKRNPPGSWKMPAPALYRRLLERCQGRVARSDLGWADDAQNAKNKAVEQEFIGMATPDEWAKWKLAQKAATNVTVSPNYIDYLLEN
jgi:hypothetical protein